MLKGQFFHQVGTLKNDAAAGVAGCCFPKIFEKRGAVHNLEDVAFVADIVGSELDNRTRLNASVWRDVVADAGRHWAECFTVVIVVGIDEGDWKLGSHVDDELPNLACLIRAQCEFLMDLWANRAVGVIPGVVDPAIDQSAQPLLSEQIVDVGLAQARRKRYR